MAWRRNLTRSHACTYVANTASNCQAAAPQLQRRRDPRNCLHECRGAGSKYGACHTGDDTTVLLLRQLARRIPAGNSFSRARAQPPTTPPAPTRSARAAVPRAGPLPPAPTGASWESCPPPHPPPRPPQRPTPLPASAHSRECQRGRSPTARPPPTTPTAAAIGRAAQTAGSSPAFRPQPF